MKSPSSPFPFYRSFDMSFIQFRLETVQRFFHNTCGGANGIPYGRIYAYFSKIRQTLRRNAGFCLATIRPSGPGLFFNPRVIQFLCTLTGGRSKFRIMILRHCRWQTFRTHGNQTFAINVQDVYEKDQKDNAYRGRDDKIYI